MGVGLGILALAGCELVDTDGDGVVDSEEPRFGWDPAEPDEDQNGMLDGQQDLDGDGLGWWLELNLGTDDTMADTDADGLTEVDEILLHGTDWLLADTDGDGISDGDEVGAGTDPLDPTDPGDPTEQQDHCGVLAASETWTGPTVHTVSCAVEVPVGVSLRIEHGATVVGAGGSIAVLDGGSVVVEGSVVSSLGIGTQSSVGSGCNGTVGASVVVSGNSFVDSNVCAGGSGLTVSVVDNSFVNGSVGVQAVSVVSQPVVSGNSFVGGSGLGVSGDGETVAPTVTGNSFTGLALPANFSGLGDLSGITDNVASNDGGDAPMFAYAFSKVTGAWDLDPAANHRHDFYGVEVTGTFNAVGADLLRMGLFVSGVVSIVDSQVASDVTVGIAVLDGGSVVVEGSVVSSLGIGTQSSVGSGCNGTVGASVVVSGNSFVDSNVCAGGSGLTVSVVDNSFVNGSVGVQAVSVVSQPVVSGNSFVGGSGLGVSGDGETVAPTVTGNSFTGLALPANFSGLGDLSGITDNVASNDGGDAPMFAYAFSKVTGAWDLDPAANHRHDFYGVEVTGTFNAVGADLLRMGLFVSGVVSIVDSQVASDVTVGIAVLDGGSVVVEGSVVSSLGIGTQSSVGSGCNGTVGASVVVSGNSFVDSNVCAGGSGLTVSVVDNSFVNGSVGVQAVSVVSQPVVSGNSFVGGSGLGVSGDGETVAPTVTGNSFTGLALPANFSGLGDLSGITDNVASNDGGDAPMFAYAFSKVTGAWDLDPAANHRHYFYAVTIAGTANATDAYLVGPGGSAELMVDDGGTLSVSTSISDGLDISVNPGGTMSASDSEFMNAGTAITAVPDLDCLTGWPLVTVADSVFHDNGFDISNGNEHWGPVGSPNCGEDIETSGTTATSISSHTHLCEAFIGTVPHPELNTSFVNFDVEGIFPDGSCPPPVGGVRWVDATATIFGL